MSFVRSLALALQWSDKYLNCTDDDDVVGVVAAVDDGYAARMVNLASCIPMG